MPAPKLEKSKSSELPNALAPENLRNWSIGEVANLEKDQARKVFDQDLATEEVELETILQQEGIGLKPEELEALKQAIPEMFPEFSSEFADYLRDFFPRLDVLQARLNSREFASTKGKKLEELTKFLEQEEKTIAKISDATVREELLSFVGGVLEIDKLTEELDAAQKFSLMSAGVDLIPILGSGKMLTEVTLGKTMDGEKLSGTRRLSHSAEAVVFLALDAVAFAGLVTTPLTFGASDLVAVGAESVKGVRAFRLSEKGYTVAKSLRRFAALCRKTGKLRSVSKTIYKFGRLLQKYPRLTGATVKIVELRARKQRQIRIKKFDEKFSNIKATPKKISTLKKSVKKTA